MSQTITPRKPSDYRLMDETGVYDGIYKAVEDIDLMLRLDHTMSRATLNKIAADADTLRRRVDVAVNGYAARY